jgi:hypothetical protein
MMGFCRIFFLEGPFWRFLGIDDLFFFFWSSRPIFTVFYVRIGYGWCVVLKPWPRPALIATCSKFLVSTLAYR